MKMKTTKAYAAIIAFVAAGILAAPAQTSDIDQLKAGEWALASLVRVKTPGPFGCLRAGSRVDHARHPYGGIAAG